MPELTVVVPIYNGEQYLEQTLDSILYSTQESLELLLIDDGCTDRSHEICMRYANRDERVRYFRQSNQGIVAARNKGIELATGQYICFCDQDDLVKPDMYERVLSAMKEQEAEVGMCSTARWIDGVESLYEKCIDKVYRGSAIAGGLLYPLLFRGFTYDFVDNDNYIYGSVWKCIFSRQLIVDNTMQFHRFIDYEDDWIFVTEALAKASGAVTLSQVGYCWRVNQKSYSHEDHYVEHMPARFHKYDDYVLKYLSMAMPKEEFASYRSVNFCEHYVALYNNALCADDRKGAMRELSDYLIQTDYHRHVCVHEQMKKSQFQRRLLLKSIQKLGIKRALFINKWLIKIKNCAEKVDILVRLERKRKLSD